MITFVISAIAHEYLFSITLEEVQGYQTAFFPIQGLAVALTLRSDRGPVAVRRPRRDADVQRGDVVPVLSERPAAVSVVDAVIAFFGDRSARNSPQCFSTSFG